MKRYLVIFAAVAFALATTGCASLSKPKAGCYWMTQDGSRWEPRADVVSKQQCFAFDSCSGGQGMSGGGCYKWANGPNAAAEKW
ncbi:MAG: hypothetical protein ACOYJ6_11265 [Caulobacterales bacterium]|jgi:hypothetical protein